MQLLVLDAREFRSMLMTTPVIGTKMLTNLAQRLSEADDAYTADTSAQAAGPSRFSFIRRSSLSSWAKLAAAADSTT